MPTIHVHLDESGDLRFTPTATRYYVFTAAWTYNPAPLAAELAALRFSLLRDGFDLQAFHATEDRQRHRDAVVALLMRHVDWAFAAAVVDKAKVNPSIREAHRFYPQFAASVLKFVFRGSIARNANRALIYTDTLPVKANREAVEKAIKQTCSAECSHLDRFGVYHHARATNAWLQIVDYCSWATFRKWEFGDERAYSQLRPRLAAPERDVLRYGDIRYYADARRRR